MERLQKIYLLGLLLPVCAFAASSQPQQINFSAESFESISSMPRLYAAGYTGDNLVEQGDLLIPLYLTNENTLLVYGQGRYNSSKNESWETAPWTASGGLLYRQIASDAVLGAYVLGDYAQSYNGHKFWSIGPGLESLGRKWDFHLNGYIPISNKAWTDEKWAHEFGIYDYFTFEEGTNNVYDRRITSYEEVGIGADAEIGRKLFKAGNTLVKGYLQGYYYNMKHNDDVTGGGIKITAQPSRYLTFSANNTYDNYNHNTFMLGAQIRLNDLFNKSNNPIDENNLTNRLLDPIERNFGTIGPGTSAPISKGYSFDLGKNLYASNGVFFDHNGSGYISPNAALYPLGTYGNPYVEERDLLNDPLGMQGIFNSIRNQFTGQVYMYFAPGTYYTSTAPGNLLAANTVKLPDGLNVLGRNYWYTTPTSVNNRALFAGSLQLMGNNYLESIMVQNGSLAPAFIEGVIIDSASNISLNNVQVGLPDSNGYTTRAIRITNSNNITFNNSQIFGYDHPIIGQTSFDSAIDISNNSNVNLENNNIVSVTTIGGYGTSFSRATSRSILLNNSALNINSNNSIIGFAYGGYAAGSSGIIEAGAAVDNVFLNNSQLNIIGNNNFFGVTVKGGTAASNNMLAFALANANNILLNGDSILNISGNNNAFNIIENAGGKITNAGSSAIIDASANCSDIFSQGDNNTTNIAGNNNTFSVISTGGMATSDTMLLGNQIRADGRANIFSSLTGANNQFNMTGKNNVLVSSSTGGFTNTLSANTRALSTASVIFVEWDSLTSFINIGSYNFLKATANGGIAISDTQAIATAQVHGIYSAQYLGAISPNIYVGNYNTILVEANGGFASERNVGSFTTVSAGAKVYGVASRLGDINIGGDNYILAAANSGKTASSNPNPINNAEAYGLEKENAPGGNIYINGGNNQIYVSAIANTFATSTGSAYAYGIDNFANDTFFATVLGSGSNVVDIHIASITNMSALGIQSGNTSSFYQGGLPIANITDLYSFLSAGNYMAFAKTTGGPGVELTDGKIHWDLSYIPW